ncbi:dimethylaniline monooxygenase [Mycolicibacterium sp. 018/SC-01/001]|uniref:flavin-containing monooxygenase n=1 Tax=Mycolicibacterium sp. 018/SC-01/001 TaxID=2592069 RepID=UPI00117D0BF1|nr:NAD(P)-binding domain-containing protein [Mycolicibacterium sp. 018/SC-01/001]TRW87979.1 dimethylaniline monooxygenase [Mycolicibacterium sp. 018/SC-01/001]
MRSSVAVIGAGPGGLVAARWLLSEGFDPYLFDQSTELGGQWAGNTGTSGVWPALYTNTSRILTEFSDLAHDSDRTFLAAPQILRYLHRYAEMFALNGRIRLNTKVTRLARHGDRWQVDTADGPQTFDRVVVASGRFQTPVVPAVPGLPSFSGAQGARSTFDFRGVEPYRGKRVLVGGCAVSALEVAAELVHGGAAAVTVTQRRQRYVLPKFAAGVPSDHRIFTRYGALAAERLPVAEVDRQLKTIVTDAGGSPEQYGAPTPDPSLFAAGVTLSQHYLPLVAEGRIDIRPWPTSVSGTDVAFADGSTGQFDGILFGTGFRLDLPFLADDIRATLGLDDVHLDADRYTFHPDLPGLAFMGMWDQSGGYFVPLELQARWLAYTWSGRVPADLAQQRAAVDAYRARRGLPQKTRMNLAAVGFARAAGCEPRLDHWPDLRRALLFGPLAPSCFRLDGPDALPDAATQFADAAAAFGAITSNRFSDREQADWDLLQKH